MSLKINEITFPTIQGEGFHIGQPAIFVRAQGCDNQCWYCDTPQARDGANARYDMNAEAIMADIELKSHGNPLLVVLTGGNPALQDFSCLLKLLAGKHYPTAIETQGSVSRNWFSDLDFITLSPKSPFEHSTGGTFKSIVACINSFGGRYRSAEVCVKVVIRDGIDLGYTKILFNMLDRCFPDNTMTYCVQPLNKNFDVDSLYTMRGEYCRLVEEIIRAGLYRVRVLPQLHVWAWGNIQGR